MVLEVSPVRFALGVDAAVVVVNVVVEVVPVARSGSVPYTKFAAEIASPFGVIVPLIVALVAATLVAAVVVVAGPEVNPGAMFAVAFP